MAEGALQARAPLRDLPRRFGVAGGAGMRLAVREGLQVVGLAARAGQGAALAAALRAAFGLDLPAAPRWVGDGRLAFAWAGPGRWTAIAEDWPGALEAALRDAASGLAAVVEQSDGRVVLRVSGPHARDALAKLVALDLHPRAFRPGDVAITQAAHIGVTLRQVDDSPCYELAAFRSYAGSLAQALLDAGAEYGVEVG